jgi:hypothetical protein
MPDRAIGGNAVRGRKRREDESRGFTFLRPLLAKRVTHTHPTAGTMAGDRGERGGGLIKALSGAL